VDINSTENEKIENILINLEQTRKEIYKQQEKFEEQMNALINELDLKKSVKLMNRFDILHSVKERVSSN
jgi:hypothetical protein